tara:strand:- start:4568 stop:4867 length:300 start_codon:yes stop_codon:yes gene_type:complete
MIDTLHIDDLDGAVTLFKSTDEGTETIAVFDEEHREVIQGMLNSYVYLLAEVKRLHEENGQLRKADWEYECLWTWLDENTNLLNTIEPLVEEWKKEMIE